MTPARGDEPRWLASVPALVAALASAGVYARLPSRMVVHWDRYGMANGWLPRLAGAAMLPLLAGALSLASDAPVVRASSRLVRGTVVLLAVTHLVVLVVNLGVPVPMARLPAIMLGALLILIGLALPGVPVGGAVGVRTPWALASQRVWARTHRFAGQSTVVAGVLMIVAGALLAPDLAEGVMVAGVVASVVAAGAYSWLTWAREHRH